MFDSFLDQYSMLYGPNGLKKSNNVYVDLMESNYVDLRLGTQVSNVLYFLDPVLFMEVTYYLRMAMKVSYYLRMAMMF